LKASAANSIKWEIILELEDKVDVIEKSDEDIEENEQI
jgi:hypothetical protein